MYKNKFDDDSTLRNNICGRTIALLRKRRGWSQRVLAEKLQKIGHDVGKNQISLLERGKRFVNDIELKALCQVLEVSADRLISGDVYVEDSSGEMAVAEKKDQLKKAGPGSK